MYIYIYIIYTILLHISVSMYCAYLILVELQFCSNIVNINHVGKVEDEHPITSMLRYFALMKLARAATIDNSRSSSTTAWTSYSTSASWWGTIAPKAQSFMDSPPGSPDMVEPVFLMSDRERLGASFIPSFSQICCGCFQQGNREREGKRASS